MKCPRCNSLQSKVLDARNRIPGRRRHRLCLKCGQKITTIETQEENPYTAWREKQEENVDRIKRMAKEMGIKLAEE